jgi:hypothetical protein
MLNVEIRIKGRIAPHWSDWFEGLAVTHTDDETILTGEILDQAALYGLVARVRDLGLSLVAVNSVEIEHHESEKECSDEILGD